MKYGAAANFAENCDMLFLISEEVAEGSKKQGTHESRWMLAEPIIKKAIK